MREEVRTTTTTRAKSIERGATCARRLVVVRASRDRVIDRATLPSPGGRPPSPRHVFQRDEAEGEARPRSRRMCSSTRYVRRAPRRDPQNPAEKLRFRGTTDGTGRAEPIREGERQFHSGGSLYGGTLHRATRRPHARPRLSPGKAEGGPPLYNGLYTLPSRHY